VRSALITDDVVAQLYGQQFCKELKSELFSFPSGETSKTRETKQRLENELLEKGFSRDTTIVALGGGVVLDLAGFLAATFCRGVDLVLIPTTLLAMVDAAIGGKTGVNTPQGKNLIGAFYFPKQIVIDLRFLTTLPQPEIWNGTVEILKAGLIGDQELFVNFSDLSWKERIQRAIEVKRRIVAQDLEERGVRRVLNVGHTVGHALETVSNYQLSHGQAVAMGIALEARISHAMGFLSCKDLAEIEKRFPPLAFDYDLDTVVQVMKLDKKIKDGTLYFALLKEIGSVALVGVPLEEVACAMRTC
jgi:3-dehydroquinate synthase